MRRGALLLATLTAPALATSSEANREIRLTPDDIAALPAHSAGAGTSGIATIRTSVLAGDPDAPGPYTIALQIPAHTSIAAHTHRDDRSAVVVSGTWYFGYGRVADPAAVKPLGPGSFYTEPSGDAHFAMTRQTPVTVIITGTGPTDTQPGGDPQQGDRQ